MSKDLSVGIVNVLFAGFWVYGAAYIALGLSRPARFHAYWSISNTDERYRERDRWNPKPWWMYISMALKVLAVVVFIYSAASGFVTVIPETWGAVDGDGDWTGTREYVAGLIAFGGVALLMSLDNNAPRLISQPIERQARIELLEAVCSDRHATAALLASLADHLATVLPGKLRDPHEYQKEWADDVHAEIVKQLRRGAERLTASDAPDPA